MNSRHLQSACCSTSVDGAMVPGMASGRGLISLRHRTKPAPGHVAGKAVAQDTAGRTRPALTIATLAQAQRKGSSYARKLTVSHRVSSAQDYAILDGANSNHD